jgi:hypothetical protein
VLVALLGATATAQADPLKELHVTVEPAIVTDDDSVDFTVTFTNLNSPQLGAVGITSPFTVNAVDENLSTFDSNGPLSKAWSLASVEGDVVRFTADTQTDRLLPGESVSVVITAITPDINADTNDSDEVHSWLAAGRQANTFNDAMGGNDVTQAFQDRDGTFVFRSEDGITTSSLGTHQTLVVSGSAVDCSTGPCKGSDIQTSTTVTITVEGCSTGTLVVDATDLFADQVGAAAFYHYLYPIDPNTGLPTACAFGSPVTVDFLYDKTLGVKAGELFFVAIYGEIDISEWDPLYVGDETPLPKCDKNRTVNCVEFVKGGSLGVNAQIKMVLVPFDPGGIAFR